MTVKITDKTKCNLIVIIVQICICSNIGESDQTSGFSIEVDIVLFSISLTWRAHSLYAWSAALLFSAVVSSDCCVILGPPSTKFSQFQMVLGHGRSLNHYLVMPEGCVCRLPAVPRIDSEQLHGLQAIHQIINFSLRPGFFLANISKSWYLWLELVCEAV